MERSFILHVITLGHHWLFSATMDYCLNRYVCECVCFTVEQSKRTLECVFHVQIRSAKLFFVSISDHKSLFVCVGAVHGIWRGLL